MSGKEAKAIDYFHHIPFEVVEQIFHDVGIEDAARWMHLSPRFEALARDSSRYHKLVIRSEKWAQAPEPCAAIPAYPGDTSVYRSQSIPMDYTREQIRAQDWYHAIEKLGDQITELQTNLQSLQLLYCVARSLSNLQSVRLIQTQDRAVSILAALFDYFLPACHNLREFEIVSARPPWCHVQISGRKVVDDDDKDCNNCKDLKTESREDIPQTVPTMGYSSDEDSAENEKRVRRLVRPTPDPRWSYEFYSKSHVHVRGIGALNEVFACLFELEAICTQGQAFLDVDSLIECIRGLPTLKSLSLGGNILGDPLALYKLTTELASSVGGLALNSLETLQLSHNASIGPGVSHGLGMSYVAVAAPHEDGSTGMSVSLQRLLGRTRGSLKHLALHNFFQLTDEDLNLLRRLCPHLERIVLLSCPQITAEALQDFKDDLGITS
eukprot:Clim_evm37s157 gene=Clim_evmTU37s157